MFLVGRLALHRLGLIASLPFIPASILAVASLSMVEGYAVIWTLQRKDLLFTHLHKSKVVSVSGVDSLIDYKIAPIGSTFPTLPF